MKKILSFTMVILMLLSMCAFPAFAAENDELAQKFYDYCVENLPENMQPSEGDTAKVFYPIEIDGVTYFRGSNWIRVEYTDVVCRFGEWNVYSGDKYQPYDLGIYAASGDEIYTLEEAYNKGFITDVSILSEHFSGRYTFYKDYVPKPENKYEHIIIPQMFTPKEWSDTSYAIDYEEIFEYYSEDISSLDEATPDYALIKCDGFLTLNEPTADIFGEYILYRDSMRIPFVYGYCIYIPETGEIFELHRACEMGIEGIEKVFTEAGVGTLLGDMDKDRKLTVKDATYIQKILADMDGYEDVTIFASDFDDTLPCAVSDFNRDGVRNIKDATAIQKKIAGLPY